MSQFESLDLANLDFTKMDRIKMLEVLAAVNEEGQRCEEQLIQAQEQNQHLTEKLRVALEENAGLRQKLEQTAGEAPEGHTDRDFAESITEAEQMTEAARRYLQETREKCDQLRQEAERYLDEATRQADETTERVLQRERLAKESIQNMIQKISQMVEN